MHRLLFVLCLFLLPGVSWAQRASDIEYSTPAAALAALRAKPGVKIRVENDWIVINDPGANAFWSIATADHPAHPTMVKRTLVDRGGAIHLLLDARCGASKEVCDRTIQQFKDGNEEIRQSLRMRR